MELSTLMERQQPIDRAIATALIAATPETWRTALMSVERLLAGQRESFRVEITSPEGFRDLISPPQELLDNVKLLSDLFGEHERPWSSVQYRVSLKPSGDWDYAADFVYVN